MEHEFESEGRTEGKKQRAKPMKLIIAHFNPKELETLDEKQGGRTYIPGTDTPHYKGLEKLFEDPENEARFMKAFENHAAGGMIGESKREIENMRTKGRFRDSVMAYIGPNTRRIFDRATADLTGNTGKNENPMTKKPEYFGLSKMLGGIGRGVSKFATGALPGAIMGGMMGGPAGAMEGGMMGGMSS